MTPAITRDKQAIERLLEIGKDCAAHMKEPYLSIDHGDLLYDDQGLPLQRMIMSSITTKAKQSTIGMNRAQWEAKHGSIKLTDTWKRIGWKWQPVVCRCLVNCILSSTSKHDSKPKTQKTSK